jgi:hypothetical protein
MLIRPASSLRAAEAVAAVAGGGVVHEAAAAAGADLETGPRRRDQKDLPPQRLVATPGSLPECTCALICAVAARERTGGGVGRSRGLHRDGEGECTRISNRLHKREEGVHKKREGECTKIETRSAQR